MRLTFQAVLVSSLALHAAAYCRNFGRKGMSDDWSCPAGTSLPYRSEWDLVAPCLSSSDNLWHDLTREKVRVKSTLGGPSMDFFWGGGSWWEQSGHGEGRRRRRFIDYGLPVRAFHVCVATHKPSSSGSPTPPPSGHQDRRWKDSDHGRRLEKLETALTSLKTGMERLETSTEARHSAFKSDAEMHQHEHSRRLDNLEARLKALKKDHERRLDNLDTLATESPGSQKEMHRHEHSRQLDNLEARLKALKKDHERRLDKLDTLATESPESQKDSRRLDDLEAQIKAKNEDSRRLDDLEAQVKAKNEDMEKRVAALERTSKGSASGPEAQAESHSRSVLITFILMTFTSILALAGAHWTGFIFINDPRFCKSGGSCREQAEQPTQTRQRDHAARRAERTAEQGQQLGRRPPVQFDLTRRDDVDVQETYVDEDHYQIKLTQRGVWQQARVHSVAGGVRISLQGGPQGDFDQTYTLPGHDNFVISTDECTNVPSGTRGDRIITVVLRKESPQWHMLPRAEEDQTTAPFDHEETASSVASPDESGPLAPPEPDTPPEMTREEPEPDVQSEAPASSISGVWCRNSDWTHVQAPHVEARNVGSTSGEGSSRVTGSS